jgi:hypothetical protein
VTAYSIASRAHARRAHKRRCLAPKRIERMTMWSAALSTHTQSGLEWAASVRRNMRDMLGYPPTPASDPCPVDSIVNCTVDQALQMLWGPVQGDA